MIPCYSSGSVSANTSTYNIIHPSRSIVPFNLTMEESKLPVLLLSPKEPLMVALAHVGIAVHPGKSKINANVGMGYF